MIRATLVFLLMSAAPLGAVELDLPATARQTVERNTGPDVYEAPVAVFSAGEVATVTLEGDVQRAAWRLDSPGLTPFQVMRPLREQLRAAGFEIALDCQAVTCGGFDFRFATETLPGPNMYVNIRAFQFVTGLRLVEGDLREAVTILASTSATSAYVQIIRAGTAAKDTLSVTSKAALPVGTADGGADDLATVLLARGHKVLNDLDFASGNSALGEGPFESLTSLADFLRGNPELRVALVGHTDTVGGLEANIAVSRARARAVRQRLIDAYGVDAARLDAEGVGYLTPIASNLEDAGREVNRRVEVVLLGRP
ncbi:OmpA family protein [Sulfitobacter sp. M57]|uniref:OmpA family protein n=1 Tax=unclassified Sulfitobacter TaxID=196795 RepID=UPI0023E2FE5C|nr:MULTISPECIES: OmpA family protein [unclassified Sulfitobacter]MDF3414697.1 OmpA family protein [Sulfitobacter sp. KE5]MDF3422178.1 OmpA family protein [Sulfitobacter sp. KE43]MDF3433243.1 OmpA family protein [Sulfitobacter sp. KE42]MDF3458883.1 OmpA family protein [Sulfitobacter sp. S74]MDF3462782.1 OmpA family protein [Sulfitobacter sp. Ks18]